MSRWAGQCPTGGFCCDILNSGLTQVGSDNVRLGVSVLDGLEKTWSLLDLTSFTSSIMPFLIVWCSYTQKT
jgi:hypothetical protein